MSAHVATTPEDHKPILQSSKDGSAASVIQDHSFSSEDSSPEADADNDVDHEPNPDSATKEPDQPRQKRKGGRKPIYATSEERKQRNRQAQAAFRERRTEYIKHLEGSINRLEASLQSLQASHRSAADECLMLRYKNSLLERILLEKGIDVTSELARKTGSPALGPTTMPPLSMPQGTQAPLQRAMINRHNQQVRRSLSSLPKVEPGSIVRQASMGSHDGIFQGSPLLQPTPVSHVSSPSAASPAFGPQGLTPPGTNLQPQIHMNTVQALSPQVMAYTQQQNGPPSIAGASSVSGSSSYYQPSPFRTHMDQLEQEYEAQADMEEEASDHDPSVPNFAPPGFMPMSQPVSTGPYIATLPQAYEHYDPNMDTDPFGLSSSMQIPTTFSYEHTMR